MRFSLVKPALRRVYNSIFLLCYRGNSVTCPICGTTLRRFKNVNQERKSPRGNICPKCLSFERHRLLWLYLRDRTDLFAAVSKKVLHVAPEACFIKRLRKLPAVDYVVSDLHSRDPAERIDLTDIPLPDHSIDTVICCHVLEHIADDRRAMREVYRILKPAGWAILNVPVDYSRQATYEDPSITPPGDRKTHFGQADHLRVYGRDYPKRLAESGFCTSEIDFANELGPVFCNRYVLLPDEMIYFCTKQ